MLRHETPCQEGPGGESGRICLPWELCRLPLGAREAEGSVSLTWRLPARGGLAGAPETVPGPCHMAWGARDSPSVP